MKRFFEITFKDLTMAYQGDTIPVAEYLMTANKLPDAKAERVNDRIGIITFSKWGKINVKEKNRREMEVLSLAISSVCLSSKNFENSKKIEVSRLYGIRRLFLQ